MSKNQSHSLQQTLIAYGIIPSICLSVFGSSSLQAIEDSSEKKSLVILERQLGQISEETNLQKKIQFLTTFVNEQAERMRALREEIRDLKNKLHQTQQMTFSPETGNYKQLYTALKQESAQSKETKNQLETLILELKNENEREKLKNQESDAQSISLITALESQVYTLEKIEEKYQQELARLSSSNNDSNNYKELYAALEKEFAEYKETQIQIDMLIQQLKDENASEKQKFIASQMQLTNLMDLLDAQNLSMESLQEHQQNQLSSSIDELQNNKILSAKLEEELAQTEETQILLEQLLRQLENENESYKQKISESEAHMNSLMKTLDELKTTHEESLQPLVADLKEERTKNLSTQKNLEETQQIYDQTVKLYNEIYSDYQSSQDQLKKLQNELDERKMNHLAEIDDLEMKIENLTNEFKNEQDKVKELQMHLTDAQTDAGFLTTVKKEHLQLAQDFDEIKRAYMSHLDEFSLQEDLMNRAQSEMEKYQFIAAGQEDVIHQLLEVKDSQNSSLSEKNQEIQRLTQKMTQTEEEVKLQFQTLAATLESEKYKNIDLQKELSDHIQSHQQNSQERSQDVEKLKNELALKDQKENEIALMKEEIALLKEHHEQEINELKNKNLEAQNLLEKFKSTQVEEGNTKMMAIQLERLQEALQQMISEKTSLQSLYQNQLINEKMLSEKLEKTREELEQHKTELETLNKTPDSE